MTIYLNAIYNYQLYLYKTKTTNISEVIEFDAFIVIDLVNESPVITSSDKPISSGGRSA